MTEIITKKFNSNTEDDCYTTSNSALIEKCEILQEKCRIVRGVFFNYLGDFEIDDIKEQNWNISTAAESSQYQRFAKMQEWRNVKNSEKV